ncbi:toxin ParE [Candidatus Termititenax dinenymphae]|uniref:Toxin ParE n=1 Tax=Candidatus Termititenax dinenymphae TaxID=2218523 RepID=A0A388TJ78_9BACT|nr:toxin ParE [Candidatus Termititenax dinenymphae]
MLNVRYLPLAKKDLHDIVEYIAGVLKSPQAAANFLSAVEKALEHLQTFPFSCRVYQSIETLNLEYRVKLVGNYLLFYVVLDNVLEVHRVIYAKRNLPQIIG